MQLIMDTEPSIDIKRNMSTLNEEVLAEKLDDVIEDLKSGLCNGNKENIQRENIISSIDEPIADNEKVEEVIASKSPIPEQSVDTILGSSNIDDINEAAVNSPKTDDVAETSSKSPKPDDVKETPSMLPKPEEDTETPSKSPKPDDVNETSPKSPKPNEKAITENIVSDEKQSGYETVPSVETENENENVDTNMKDLEGSIDNESTEDISLRMEEDSPTVGEDQTNNDEESDPIIITGGPNGQDGQEIRDKIEEMIEKTDSINSEIEKIDKVNKNEEDEVTDNMEGGNVDESMEVVDDKAVQILENDKTCLNGLKEDEEIIEGKKENVECINKDEDEKIVDNVVGTFSNENDQDVPKNLDLDDAKLHKEIIENDILSPSMQTAINEVNNEQAQHTEKTSEMDTNNVDNSGDSLKQIETVDLDDEEKESENPEKFLKVDNSDRHFNVPSTLENSVSNKNEISVADMETVDLIDEKESSGLESMDVDINGETGEPEEKAISLSSEKDDIFDCEDNLDDVVTAAKALDDKTESIELKSDDTPMDEDVQHVENKNSNKSLDSNKEETINIPDDEVKVHDNKCEEQTKEISQTPSQPNQVTEEAKPTPSVLKLSNTLNILSDDEEDITEPPKTESPSQSKESESATDNKCIDIEDDDDIMLIDEDENCKDTRSEPSKPEAQSTDAEPKVELKVDEQESEKAPDVETSEELPESAEKAPQSPGEKSPVDKEKLEDEKEEEANSDAKTDPIKPLLPSNFLKTCKKNMADMTRDDLEEFCILKIVESVVDRSSLSEIKSKLKTMTQCIEEYKKKAQMLQKQNRDLQVVLKTIQEEQKNSKTVTPLKITRSVGMQVLMTERSTIRRKPPAPGSNSNNTTPTKTPSPRAPNQRAIKVPAAPSPQQIPVPRLIPASNSPAAKNNLPQINSTTSKTVSPINGVRTNAQKAEKRALNRNHSVTVDLTDDEPPAKILNRNSTPTPLRVVPPHLVPQNLLAATPRHPISQNNNPRKVYIPISGPQNQNIRAGQAIMLKSVSAPNQPAIRPRGPQTHMTRMPQNQVRMSRVQNRHPAPLPETTKQYPGTYSKALPPAPDLKLSKVENGIVISWKIEGYQEDSYEEIASYQLYAYQETNSPPSTALWKKIGDVKALPLPMACTLTQFMAGFKYYFAVRAVDIRSRIGPFSLPGSILLLNKL